MILAVLIVSTIFDIPSIFVGADGVCRKRFDSVPVKEISF